MFGQKKKPYQTNKLIRHTASVRQGNAADVLIRGGLMSIHDVPETVGIKLNSSTEVNDQFSPLSSVTAEEIIYNHYLNNKKNTLLILLQKSVFHGSLNLVGYEK